MENINAGITFIEKEKLQNIAKENAPILNKKERFVLFVLYFLTFVFLNLVIFFTLFKTSWLTSRIISYSFLNYPLNFLNGENTFIFLGAQQLSISLLGRFIAFLIFYTYPSLLLSTFFLKKFYNIEDSLRVVTRWTVRPKVIIGILLFLFILVGGIGTYGFLWWIFPALAIVALEFWLFRKLSVRLLYFSKSINSFYVKLAILPAILMFLYLYLYISSPLKNCEPDKYQCIAAVVGKTNDPKLCEKVASPYSASDCYEFLAIANENICYCELISLEREKKMCYMENDLKGEKEFLSRWHKNELQEAKFKDNSILNKLNCKKVK